MLIPIIVLLHDFKLDGRFIRPEFVPVQYGGLSRPGDLENGPPKPASEFTIKGAEKVFLEIDGIEVVTNPWLVSSERTLIIIN